MHGLEGYADSATSSREIPMSYGAVFIEPTAGSGARDDSLAPGGDTPDPSRPVTVHAGPGVCASSSSSLLNGVPLPSLAAIAVLRIPCFRAVALLPSKNPIVRIAY